MDVEDVGEDVALGDGANSVDVGLRLRLSSFEAIPPNWDIGLVVIAMF